MLTQEQIKQRLKFITGSDAPVICGLSPFKTPFALWMEKTRRAEQDDISALNHIKFGNYFEEGVAKWFAAESSKSVIYESKDMIVHPSLPWMAGNYDYKIMNENAILECKTAFSDAGWGDSQTDQIPAYYLMQVAHYCAVGGFDRAYIAVVFAMKREMRWYIYERNLELESKLIAREQAFWIDNVISDVAPEPINTQDILSIYKETTTVPVIATSEIEFFVDKIKDNQYKIKHLNKIVEQLKEKVQMHMQDADTLLSSNSSILSTWKYTKPFNGFDKKLLEKEMPEIHDKYVTAGKKQRRFRILGDDNE